MSMQSNQVVYDGAEYFVREICHGADTISNSPIVVTFPHAGKATPEKSIGFGQKWLQSKKIDCYCLINRKPDWFQSQSFFDAMSAVRERIEGRRQIVTYGASMGGYGALLASRALNATRVISVAPQYSIQRDIVPFEKRWKVEAEEVGEFIHDVDLHISDAARISLIYDPRSDDKHHVDLFRSSHSWDHIPLPFVGHMPLMVLQHAGLLSRMMEALILGDDNARFKPGELLAGRRRSSMYLRNFGVHAARLGRFELTRYARQCCLAMGDQASADKLDEVEQKLLPRSKRWVRRAKYADLNQSTGK